MEPPTLQLLLALACPFFFFFVLMIIKYIHLRIRALRFYIFKYKTLKTILKLHSGFKMASCLPLSSPSPHSSTQMSALHRGQACFPHFFGSQSSPGSSNGLFAPCALHYFCKHQGSMLWREPPYELNKVTNICSGTVEDADRPPRSSATMLCKLLISK